MNDRFIILEQDGIKTEKVVEKKGRNCSIKKKTCLLMTRFLARQRVNGWGVMDEKSGTQFREKELHTLNTDIFILHIYSHMAAANYSEFSVLSCQTGL